MNRKQLSKFLSLVLRHKPEVLGLQLDKHGWVKVTELLERMNAQGKAVTRAELEEMVATNPKQRFKLDLAQDRIRANQGHSLPVDIELHPQQPPSVLYHGTAQRNLSKIKAKGLQKMNRQYVHLSNNYDTALEVGRRYGKAIVLTIDCERMLADGLLFFCSENGVWLTEQVASSYIQFPDATDPN